MDGFGLGWELGGHGQVNEFGLGLPAIVASFLCWEIQQTVK